MRTGAVEVALKSRGKVEIKSKIKGKIKGKSVGQSLP
jgi:hypothetical protein